MPEAECVGGPLDGLLKSFYGDEFPVPSADIAPGAPEGHYCLIQRTSPVNGVRRMVWQWREAA